MIGALLLAAALVSPHETELAARLPELFAKSAAHYRAIDAAASPLMRGDSGDLLFPHGYDAKTGSLDMRSVYWWTSGHFPGTLWYLHEATGDPALRDAALKWTEIVAPNAQVTNNHDVGFIMHCSFGNARRILKTDRYDALLRETASSLAMRYSDDLGLIRSWGDITNRTHFLVIPDNLMNLELLECVAKFSGEARFDRIARSHATVTMRNHFRADGGAYHVLDYDPRTKRVRNIDRGQGASCFTAWARGQSWAIYGYAMMFRETRDRAYLNFAQKVADFAIDNPNMPADGVPYWDYGAPGEERDTSAASIMASALLELCAFAELDATVAAKYRAFAVRQLCALASDAYFAKPGENGDFLLKHGVGNKPGDSEVDTPLDYGDYYFVEALLRFRKLLDSSASSR